MHIGCKKDWVEICAWGYLKQGFVHLFQFKFAPFFSHCPQYVDNWHIHVHNSLLQNFILFLGPDSPNTCSLPSLHRPCYPVCLNFRRSLTTICCLVLLTILQTHPLPGLTLWIKDKVFPFSFPNMFQAVALTERKMKSGTFM